ncbi:hypothetical protein CCP3SC1AL1_1190015 [Gammaproteobacteria bacterium]
MIAEKAIQLGEMLERACVLCHVLSFNNRTQVQPLARECLAMARLGELQTAAQRLYAGEMHKGYVKTEAQIFSREE